MRPYRTLGLIMALTFLAAEAASAASYTLAPVAKFGDKAGGVQISTDPDADFEVGTLNDNGQLSFVTENVAGGEMLGLYSGGAWTPIVAAGGPAPFGQWPADMVFLSPVSMNQLGNIAFTIKSESTNPAPGRTFFWDAGPRQTSSLVQNGDVVGFSATWDRGGDWVTAINNRNEVAYVAGTQDPLSHGRSGVFFRQAGGNIIPVVLPDAVLGDNSQIIDASDPHLNDAGSMVFTVRRVGDPQDAGSAYLWQEGARIPVAVVGTRLPGGHTVANVLKGWVNNNNNTILLAVNADTTASSNQIEPPVSLYRWDNGVLTAVAVPGQTMPDGSKLLSVQDFGVSFPNELGQHAFLAFLEGGASGAYLMDSDGKLSLVLKSDSMTNLGRISNVGEGAGTSTGIALNSSGQVALTARIETGLDTVFLLTPG